MSKNKEEKNNKNRTFEENIELLEQSLNGAQASMNMAKKVMKALRNSTGNTGNKSEKKKKTEKKPKVYKGKKGVFDGQFMVTGNGKKYQVPENYASKSLLVYGDTLKLIEEDGKNFFKQVEEVEHYKTEAVLVKKAGRWTAVTEHGSHKVLPASVAYYEAEEGDELTVVLPAENKSAPFAAIQEVVKTRDQENKRTKDQENKRTKDQENKRTRDQENKRTRDQEKKRTRDQENKRTRDQENKRTKDQENKRTRDQENKRTKELRNGESGERSNKKSKEKVIEEERLPRKGEKVIEEGELR